MASCNDCCELRLEQPTMPSHSRSPCCCIAVTRSSAVPSRISEYDRPTYGVRTRCDGHTRQLFRKRTRPPRTTNRQERSRGRKNFIRRLRERVPSIARYQRHQDPRGRILGSHRPHEARMSRQMLLCSSRHESWILLSSSVARWRAKTRRMSLA
jgi:hypothetical protein